MSTTEVTASPEKPKKGKERYFVGWEPSGPVRSMIANYMRGKSRGAKTDLFERMVVKELGPQNPKLMERWKLLQKAAAITE